MVFIFSNFIYRFDDLRIISQDKNNIIFKEGDGREERIPLESESNARVVFQTLKFFPKTVEVIEGNFKSYCPIEHREVEETIRVITY